MIPFFIAAWYGIQAGTDAFFLSYAIILMLQSLFAQALETVSVPVIRTQIAKNENLGLLIGRLLIFGSAIIAALLLVLLMLLEPLLPVITNFPPTTLRLLEKMLWEISPLVILTFWSSILSGVLNAYKRFMLPALSPLIRAAVILLIAYFCRATFGIQSIIIGYLLGEFCRLLILFLVCRRTTPFRLVFSTRFNRQFLEFFIMAGYQMITVIARNINLAVDKMMAARLGEGRISLLHYADRLYMIPLTLFLSGMLMPILSHWSEEYERSKLDGLKRNLNRTLRGLASCTIGLTVLGILLRRPIVRLAYHHGQFPVADLQQIELVFSCVLLGLTPGVLFALVTRALLILKKTNMLVLGALGTVILNIVFNLFLMKIWGIAGIALSTSLTHIFYLLYLWNRFNKCCKDNVLSAGSMRRDL
ncbi:MAG: polysaccharide biosynthesis C-terminal domain-containing protein [Candidatus Aminicenantes bacterium]|nr:polysaccharide biosynthesis C-terminal domain-containing protein [Candidatus Aminicenantes bacterium]